MSVARKMLSRIVSRRTNSETRKILSQSEFRRAVLCERDRSDRREIPFCILTLNSDTRSSEQTTATMEALENRLRFTDELSLFSDKVIGILLVDTETDSACKLATELADTLKPVLKNIKIEVFSYPFDDGELTDRQSKPKTEPKTTSVTSSGNVVDIQPQSLSFAVEMPIWKRGFDLIFSITSLVLLLPFFVLTALAIKLTTRGPVFFSQWREGRNGQKFKIYKFRTMTVDAESRQEELRHLSEQDGPAFKIKDDPRLTWFGSFLRKSCFDETPQLINILKGEMTLVGPRPLPVNESRACTKWQRRRLDVVPGMTCFWQVYGNRHVSFEEWMRMDEEYIRSAGLMTDLRILFRTALFVLIRRASV